MAEAVNAKRVVLAYSGGLDTSVAVRWIQEEWGAEVVALAACDRLLALDDIHTVVPGHGPVTDLGAVANLKDYFQRLTTHARDCLDAGLTPLDAARSIDLGPYKRLREPERLVANINALYHDLGADVATDPFTVITLMAESVEVD